MRKCQIVTLPKLDKQSYDTDGQATSLAHAFRDFRLLGLETAPAAFAASYHEESQRGIDQTIERLANIKATHFVALPSGHGHNPSHAEVYKVQIEELLSKSWLGTIVILGPQDDSSQPVTARADPFATMTTATAGQPDTTPEEQLDLHYHLNGMFVVQTARGSGVGRRLIEAALEKARVDGVRLRKDAVCTIIVDEWNEAAKSLYEKCGFGVVARETYVQRPRGLVQGESEVKERIALRMEYRYCYSSDA